MPFSFGYAPAVERGGEVVRGSGRTCAVYCGFSAAAADRASVDAPRRLRKDLRDIASGAVYDWPDKSASRRREERLGRPSSFALVHRD